MNTKNGIIVVAILILVAVLVLLYGRIEKVKNQLREVEIRALLEKHAYCYEVEGNTINWTSLVPKGKTGGVYYTNTGNPFVCID